jgi:hypothetical protein
MGFLLVAVAFVLQAPMSQGAIFQGKLAGIENWRFVSRFAFLPSSTTSQNFGRCKVEVKYPRHLKNLQVNFHYKDYEAWEAVYDSNKLCHERVLAADRSFVLKDNIGDKDIYTQFELEFSRVRNTPDESNVTLQTVTEAYHKANDKAVYRQDILFDTRSVRWFFVAFSSCDPQCMQYNGNGLCSTSLDIEYNLTMTNGEDLKHRQLSGNEIGIRETVLAFFVLECLLLVLAWKVVRSLRRKRKLHHTVKILAASVLAQWCALLALFIFWDEYAHHGYNRAHDHATATRHPDVVVLEKAQQVRYNVGRSFQAVADALLVALILLLGKGWTIVRRKISASGRVKITVFLAVYCWTLVVTFLWSEFLIPRLDSVYMFSTPPGYVVICLRVAVTLWLWHAYSTTLAFNSKRRFYTKFNYVGTAFFMSLPIACLLSNVAIEPWVREKIVWSVELCSVCFAQAILLALYNPDTAFNLSFPFHQVGRRAGGRAGGWIVM